MKSKLSPDTLSYFGDDFKYLKEDYEEGDDDSEEDAVEFELLNRSNVGPETSLRKLNMNPDRTYNCLVKNCDAVFKNRRERKCHITLIHGSRISCPYEGCPAFFNTSTFYHHIKHVHEKLRKPCANCGKPILAYYMGEHLARCNHDGSKSFKCKVEDCTKAFNNVYDLRHHTRTVHQEPIDCPILGCSVKMKPKSLRNHLKFMHSNEVVPKKKCPNCDKSYVPNSFTQHYKRCLSDGEKKYKCTIDGCQATFLTDYYRNNHVYVVHRGLVSCPFENCDSRIKGSYLAQHIRRRHPRIGKLKFQSAFLSFLSRELNVKLVDYKDLDYDEIKSPSVIEPCNAPVTGSSSETASSETAPSETASSEIAPSETASSETATSESERRDLEENSRDTELDDLIGMDVDWPLDVFEEVEEELIYDFSAF